MPVYPRIKVTRVLCLSGLVLSYSQGEKMYETHNVFPSSCVDVTHVYSHRNQAILFAIKRTSLCLQLTARRKSHAIFSAFLSFHRYFRRLNSKCIAKRLTHLIHRSFRDKKNNSLAILIVNIYFKYG